VSNKCHRLAIALHSLSTRISYEDVQTAATVIAQCTVNALNV
jgi:hypothetical protein